jgi:hypothetical protein
MQYGRKAFVILALLLGAVLATSPLLGQSGAGNLSGTVRDETGAVLPGTTVTATNTATGLKRVVVAAGDGAYRFVGLPVGTYTVAFELAAFAPVTVEGFKITVATEHTLDVTMKLAKLAEALTITAEIPVINASAAIGTAVSQEELENLPLNGRQFANLGALAPGTTLAYNSDPTKPGQLTIQLVGGNGRNVNFLVDGGDNTDDTIGGALQNFNLESVQEFNIKTMQYKAEYGRSSGGVLSVVTKSGTNEFKGSAFAFFRDDRLNSKTETEKQAGADKQAYDRKQYGVSFGGPIVKDQVHFFTTYEKIDRETNYTVDTGGLFPTYDGTVVPLPFTDTLVTAKVTYNASAKQYLQVRYGYQKNEDKYGASPLAAPSALGTITNKYESLLVGHTLQIGDDKFNEFLFQYSKFNNLITADSHEPQIYYPSGFHTGENLNTPQATNQTKYQYKDDFSFSRLLGGSRHEFKTGVNYIHEPVLGGDFSTGLAGQYYALEDRIGSPIQYIEKYGGYFYDDTPVDQYSVYFQDDWYATSRLTVNVGIRYDLWTGFDLDQRSNPIWQTLHTQRTYTEDYLKDFWNDDGVLDNDRNNWSPRLGFTCDIKGNGKQLLRGGLGRYYDFPYTNATILFPASAVQSNYGLIYSYYDANGIRNPDGTFFQPGQPLPPNQGGAPSPTVEVASPTLATPYSDQISLGYSWQVNNWLGLNIEAVSVRYRDIPFRFRANLCVDANHNNVCEPNLGEQNRFPDFGSFRIWYGKGEAKYNGLNIGFRARRSDLEFQGFYTYSKAEGNVLAGADEFRLTPGEYQADVGGTRLRRDQLVNPLDPGASENFGPLYTDARHRFTIGALYHAPWGILVSGMYRYRSPLPYTNHANTDLNGDGTILDLPPGVEHVNAKRGFSFSQFDLRLAKEFLSGDGMGFELIAEVFNLFNAKNPARPDRFGHATAYAGDPLQGEQRLAQLGVRVSF